MKFLGMKIDIEDMGISKEHAKTLSKAEMMDLIGSKLDEVAALVFGDEQGKLEDLTKGQQQLAEIMICAAKDNNGLH